MNKNIALSILNVKDNDLPDFLQEYKESIDKISKIKNSNMFSYIVHFDVMDGKFVNNIGVDIKHIKLAKELGFYVDTHLMVQNPIEDKYIDNAILYGTDDITIHYEIENFEYTLKYLNEKKKELKAKLNRDLVIGISIKPNTKVEEVLKYKDMFTKLLVMSVEPGLGGQKYIDSTNEKLKHAKLLLKNKIIQVDGGINFNTIREPINIGVDSLVVGTYLTNSKELLNNIQKIEIVKDIEYLPKNSNIEFDKRILQIIPGGYGEGDILLGITIPNTRKIVNKWYRQIDIAILDEFISSKYHEYRRYACITLSEMMNNKNVKNKKEEIYNFFEKNIRYVNNWDLTDIVAPNVLGSYLFGKEEKVIKSVLLKYISNKNLWIKRIGVVACLKFAKSKNKDIPLYIIDKVLYSNEELINKAVGWVLREIYKVYPKDIVDYLSKKNKEEKLPKFVLSYAIEKMSIKEKQIIKK